MDYLSDFQAEDSKPQSISEQACAILEQGEKAYISRYALGRDYHKLIRKRLASIATFLDSHSNKEGNRGFVDSAPVLERAYAEKAGLGWIGKNTLLINSRVGSWFFLGEILTDIPLPIDPPQETQHCGSCQACLDVCPTKAFAGPWQLDARRCISYLTIELRTSIPTELRPLMGNRVFGCDDCQLVCPWNKFAKPSTETDFQPRHQLQDRELLSLFLWTEEEFLRLTEGSSIRRIGYECWLRNLAVGLGNAPYDEQILLTLSERRDKHGEMVAEHIQWAIEQQMKKRTAPQP